MSRVVGQMPAMLGLLGLIAGCAVEPGGAGYGPDVGYPFGADPGYLVPGGMDYGGWGSGFDVGPYGGGGGYRFRGGREQHAFRAAPPGRPTPSIPHGPRPGTGGGGRGGGFGRGGSGGGRR